MIKKILILYIEGYENPQPKQEKHLFQANESKRIWDKYFRKLRFDENSFQIIPQHFISEQNKRKYYKILDRKIGTLFVRENDNVDIFLHLIITGDHDEINNMKIIENREMTANEIKDKYKNKNNIKTEIILKRKKIFKIEYIMSEIIGSKVNKKILREKFNGNECPYITELMTICEPKIKVDKIIENMEKSNHPLLKYINEIK